VPCLRPLLPLRFSLSMAACTHAHTHARTHTAAREQLDKARAVLEQQPKEREEFERYVEHISRQTGKAEAEIGALKEQLVVARAVRQQREEYEAMAKLVNEFPAEAASRRAQAALDAETEEMAAEEARLREALAFRRRQLAFVVNAVQDLKAGLEHDLRVEEEKERYMAEKEKEQQALSAAAASEAAGGGGDEVELDTLDGTTNGGGEGEAAMDEG
jgi:hypothetical protein